MSSETEAKTARGEWGSRFGFLMAMIGAMVGVGNIWRFPYITGENGGGAFILAYVLLLLLLAVPGLMAEVALGRYTGKGVIGAFRDVVGPGGLVGFGVVVLLVNVALMSYYAPLIGWTLYYALHALLFTFTSPGFDPGTFFDAFLANSALTVGMHTAVMALIAGVLALGIRRGVERVVVVAVPALFVSLLVIALRGLTLPGATEGLVFAFGVDWSALTRSQTWLTALGQSLFSTGLGWGIALTVGSYLREYDDVPLGGGIFTAIGESSVGVLAIFAVFPIVFAFDLDPAEGAGLAFVTFPQVFPELAGGGLWAILFFAGFFLAAFTSGLVITEVAVTTVAEETRLTRLQTVLVTCGVIWLLGLPSALSVDFLGRADFVFGNWGLPLATLCIIGVIGWKLGPERLRLLSVNQNAGVYVGRWWNPFVKFVIPGVMLFIMALFAYQNFGDPRMVAGMAVLVTFPLLGYVVMRYADRNRTGPAPGDATGGDD